MMRCNMDVQYRFLRYDIMNYDHDVSTVTTCVVSYDVCIM